MCSDSVTLSSTFIISLTSRPQTAALLRKSPTTTWPRRSSVLKLGPMENAKYLCRMCRQELFTEDDLEVHAAGAQHISRRKLGHEKPDRSCQSYFLKETSCGTLGWLGSLSELEGKLACPNARCLVRVGHYNWSGSQCSCGSWIVPAIQVPKSKVDKKDAESIAGTKVVFVDAAAYGDAAPVLDAIAEAHGAAVEAVEQGSSMKP